MIYSFECPSGYEMGFVGGYLGCFDPSGASQSGTVAPVAGVVDYSVPLTSSDISVLLSAALGVFALAWGFKMIGKLLFKDA